MVSSQRRFHLCPRYCCCFVQLPLDNSASPATAVANMPIVEDVKEEEEAVHHQSARHHEERCSEQLTRQ
jgi:hypothetical protein